MKELSLNVLDIAQNSVVANASLIIIETAEDTAADLLTIIITDNGKGMTEEQVARVIDPFYTTRTTRKVGLGIPLYKMAAEMTGGSFEIKSEPGVGTTVTATFVLSSVDRMPIGDMEGTVEALIQMNPELDFVYNRKKDGAEFTLDTRELREMLDGVPLNNPDVGVWIKEYLAENLQAIN